MIRNVPIDWFQSLDRKDFALSREEDALPSLRLYHEPAALVLLRLCQSINRHLNQLETHICIVLLRGAILTRQTIDMKERRKQ